MFKQDIDTKTVWPYYILEYINTWPQIYLDAWAKIEIVIENHVCLIVGHCYYTFSSAIPAQIVKCNIVVLFVATFKIWTFFLKIRITTFNVWHVNRCILVGCSHHVLSTIWSSRKYPWLNGALSMTPGHTAGNCQTIVLLPGYLASELFGEHERFFRWECPDNEAQAILDL